MNIESAQYNEVLGDRNIKAVIDGTRWSIPLDPDNRHYQATLEWAKIDGNTIEEADLC